MKQGICEVHRLVDRDSTIREVEYCDICKADICKECYGNLPKRAKAAGMKLFERTFKKK